MGRWLNGTALYVEGCKVRKRLLFFFVNMSFVHLMQYFSILNEIEIYVKSQVLEKMREKGVAESDMKPSDVDLEKDYVSSESRFVFTLIRATVLFFKAGLKKLKIKRFILTSIRRLFLSALLGASPPCGVYLGYSKPCKMGRRFVN